MPVYYLNAQLIATIDQYLKDAVGYEPVTKWWDGSQMDDTKVDGVVYRKYDNNYYKMILTRGINPDNFPGSDSEKLQAAFDISSIIRGSVVELSNRTYTIDQQINVSGSFYLRGFGFANYFPENGKLYEGDFKNYLGGSKLVAKNGIEHIFKITGAPYNGDSTTVFVSSVYCSGVMFFGDTSNVRATNGIYIETSGAPSRPLIVENCTFYQMNNGIYVRGVDTASIGTGISTVSVRNNSMCFNNVAFKARGQSAIILCDFSNNNAEANIVGAIDFSKGEDVNTTRVLNGPMTINNNMLEGQPAPINVFASKSNITIENNYFESSYLQEITVIGNRINTVVNFGKQFTNNDANLKINLQKVNYRITSPYYSSKPIIKCKDSLEIEGSFPYSIDSGTVVSKDFKSIEIDNNPIYKFIYTPNSSYLGYHGNMPSVTIAGAEAISLQDESVRVYDPEKVYMVAFTSKGASLKTRIYDLNAGVELVSAVQALSQNDGEVLYMTFFTGVTSAKIKVTISHVITTTEVISEIANIGIHEYSGVKKYSFTANKYTPEIMETQANSAAITIDELKTDLNNLITKMKLSGLMKN